MSFLNSQHDCKRHKSLTDFLKSNRISPYKKTFCASFICYFIILSYVLFYYACSILPNFYFKFLYAFIFLAHGLIKITLLFTGLVVFFSLLNIKQFYHIIPCLNALHRIQKFLMKVNISTTWRRNSFFIFYSIHIILFLAIYVFILYLKLSFGLGNTFKFIMDFPCLLLRHVMT